MKAPIATTTKIVPKKIVAEPELGDVDPVIQFTRELMSANLG